MSILSISTLTVEVSTSGLLFRADLLLGTTKDLFIFGLQRIFFVTDCDGV